MVWGAIQGQGQCGRHGQLLLLLLFLLVYFALLGLLTCCSVSAKLAASSHLLRMVMYLPAVVELLSQF